MKEEHLCDIVGLTGGQNRQKTVELSFDMGRLWVTGCKAGIVHNNTFSHCFLLGLDSLSTFNINVDLYHSDRQIDSKQIASLLSPVLPNGRKFIMVMSKRASHAVEIQFNEQVQITINALCLKHM